MSRQDPFGPQLPLALRYPPDQRFETWLGAPAALAQLEKLGFRYVSGNKHHKLEWAGIRFPLAKTPSDYRACLNSAAEIANRVF